MRNLKNIKVVILIIVIQLPLISVMGQNEIKQVRQGNRSFKDNNYTEAETSYRRSLDENPEYNNAVFNLGDALYKQEKYDDAIKSFKVLASSDINTANKAETYYNIGNTLLKSNKLKESIEAYKEALRNDPLNNKAKYNLAYAQDQLKKQEEQEQNKDQQNKDQNKDQEDKKDQDNKDKDSEDQNKDQDQNKEQDQNKDQEDNKEDQNQQDKKNQPQQMSKEDAERLLQALAADEQKVQEKVKKAKAALARVKTLKNW